MTPLAEDWARRRPPSRVVHLDSAAAGRTSYAVQQAVAAHLRREAQLGAYVAQEAAAPVIEAGRAGLATLLGVPAAGLAFVESASAALRTLLLAWPRPAAATVGVAPSEWGANLHAFRAHGYATRLLPVDAAGRIEPERLGVALATDPPSAVHVVAAAAHRGLLQPVAEIARVCLDAGVPLWVDAAQALGQVDVSPAADAVYATSRKWLCGPRGVGVLGIAERWWDRLVAEPLPLQPDAPPVARLESGEANIAGRVGLGVAVTEYLAAGPPAIRVRLAAVARAARAELAGLPRWRLDDGGAGAVLALYPTAGQDVVAERQRLLASSGVLVTASVPARAPHDHVGPSLRVSPHVDATPAQIEALAAALL